MQTENAGLEMKLSERRRRRETPTERVTAGPRRNPQHRFAPRFENYFRRSVFIESVFIKANALTELASASPTAAHNTVR